MDFFLLISWNSSTITSGFSTEIFSVIPSKIFFGLFMCWKSMKNSQKSVPSVINPEVPLWIPLGICTGIPLVLSRTFGFNQEMILKFFQALLLRVTKTFLLKFFRVFYKNYSKSTPRNSSSDSSKSFFFWEPFCCSFWKFINTFEAVKPRH